MLILILVPATYQKMQQTSAFHHLQYIMSLQDFENLEKSLYARDKAENQYWLAVIFGLSSGTALKTDMILKWKSLNMKNIVREHSSSLHSQMQS